MCLKKDKIIPFWVLKDTLNNDYIYFNCFYSYCSNIWARRCLQTNQKIRLMSHPYHHALSSVKKHGGHWRDYIYVHSWFDETKAHFPDMRHRALRHHAEGIFWCEQHFGPVITNSDGKEVPVRFIGEQHVMEDIGWIPTIADYLKEMNQAGWMYKPGEGRKMLKQIKEEKLDYVTEQTNKEINIDLA